MIAEAPQLTDYLSALRAQVCSHCIERPPGGPPCALRGKRCGIELQLEKMVEVVHRVRGNAMEPYIDLFHEHVCSDCPNRSTSQCPCPLEYLLLLAVEAIDGVDEEREAAELAQW